MDSNRTKFREDHEEKSEKGFKGMLLGSDSYSVQKGKEFDLQLPTVETCYKLLNGINRYLS